MSKIRLLYEQFGAENYYRDHADEYANPHLPEIADLLGRNLHRLDCSGGVLDFSAGGGEVTLALQKLHVENISGCDPFTFDLYAKNTGQPCLRHSFEDVLKGAPLGHFSLIISSFALHLCPVKDLWPLAWHLFQAAPTLVIITPHKRPELENLPGIQLVWEDFSLTERGKKVRMKAYRMVIC